MRLGVPLEHDIQSLILNYLGVEKFAQVLRKGRLIWEGTGLYIGRHGLWWRNNGGGAKATYTNKSGQTKTRFIKYGVRGAADILGSLRVSGRAAAIEVKRPGEKLDADQIQWRDWWIQEGNGLWAMVTSLQEAQEAVREWVAA